MCFVFLLIAALKFGSGDASVASTVKAVQSPNHQHDAVKRLVRVQLDPRPRNPPPEPGTLVWSK